MGTYVTPTEVAQFLGYDENDAAIIADITLILSYVEPQVENYCHVVLAPSTGSKIFNGTGNYVLQSNLLIRSLSDAEIIDDDENVISTIDLDGVFLGPKNSRHGVYRYIERKRTHGTWPRGEENIKLTGDWGFATTPGPVKAAVSMSVKSMFDSRDYNEFIKYESSLSRNQQFKDNFNIIPAPARNILNYYRMLPIAFPES